jgi:hypothetical protein
VAVHDGAVGLAQLAVEVLVQTHVGAVHRYPFNSSLSRLRARERFILTSS